MNANLTLVLVAAVLISAGVYLLLERSLTRILVGVLLAGNGVNILFLVASGEAKGAPIIGTNPADGISDPLPQAMVLTAIVITLGVATFLLTLAYRSFQLEGHDEVRDDVEDAHIRALADSDLASQSYDDVDSSLPSEDDEEIEFEVVPDDQPDYGEEEVDEDELIDAADPDDDLDDLDEPDHPGDDAGVAGRPEPTDGRGGELP
ncbi:Na(+)/H(+) antiporter subunit C [Microlunatus ginsengisoli]|uniref:Na(+)/H(+) antiporter subunit C n=1 Tax=Microlunatus ginsengisoli TaxID=363863 RepID=A0ABP6ZN28_9ACTN